MENLVANQGERIEPFPDLPLANLINFCSLQFLINVRMMFSTDRKITVPQSSEPEWMFQRSKRLTTSNFGKVIKRKRPHTEFFLRDIFVPKDLSKVSSIRYGRQQELIVRTLYSRKIQRMPKQFIVFDAGLVVNSTFPYLGASLDGKECNRTEKKPIWFT